eukprot:15477774-Alexandrium_andersonii.AAC.1
MLLEQLEAPGSQLLPWNLNDAKEHDPAKPQTKLLVQDKTIATEARKQEADWPQVGPLRGTSVNRLRLLRGKAGAEAPRVLRLEIPSEGVSDDLTKLGHPVPNPPEGLNTSHSNMYAGVRRTPIVGEQSKLDIPVSSRLPAQGLNNGRSKGPHRALGHRSGLASVDAKGNGLPTNQPNTLIHGTGDTSDPVGHSGGSIEPLSQSSPNGPGHHTQAASQVAQMGDDWDANGSRPEPGTPQGGARGTAGRKRAALVYGDRGAGSSEKPNRGLDGITMHFREGLVLNGLGEPGRHKQVIREDAAKTAAGTGPEAAMPANRHEPQKGHGVRTTLRYAVAPVASLADATREL